jgi:hypothetical protein
MDKAMEKKGWTRIVGVAHEEELVAIYMPANRSSSNRIQCCLAVLSHRDLVVVAAHGNPEPLMQVLMKRFELEQRHRELAQR